MAAFVVLEPPPARGATLDDAATRAELVRDGFTIFGFLLPMVWLLWQRLWVEALIALAATVLLAAAAERLGLGLAGSALSLLVSLYIGLEGQVLRVAARVRRGWRPWGVVEADGLSDAEARYLVERLADQRLAEGRTEDERSAPASQAREARSAPALGLLSYPGSR